MHTWGYIVVLPIELVFFLKQITHHRHHTANFVKYSLYSSLNFSWRSCVRGVTTNVIISPYPQQKKDWSQPLKFQAKQCCRGQHVLGNNTIMFSWGTLREVFNPYIHALNTADEIELIKDIGLTWNYLNYKEIDGWWENTIYLKFEKIRFWYYKVILSLIVCIIWLTMRFNFLIVSRPASFWREHVILWQSPTDF